MAPNSPEQHPASGREDAPSKDGLSITELDDIQTSLVKARTSSGYAQCATWSIENGNKLISEVRRLRMAFRLNMLRWAPATSHAEIDAFLDGAERVHAQDDRSSGSEQKDPLP